jgi:tellurite resistance protein
MVACDDGIMSVDHARLEEMLQSLHAKLTGEEAGAIVDVARLAASIDGKMDLSEMSMVSRLSGILYGMAGVPATVVPANPPGPQRLHEIGRLLESTGPRELAFASAMVVMHTDQKITSHESDLARRLAEALMLQPSRAKEIDDRVAAVVRNAG